MQKNLISIIAAMGANGGIGKDGSIPWRVKADLKQFKVKTLGQPCIMGRKTFESIVINGRTGLPGRPNIIVTRTTAYDPPTHCVGDVHVVYSIGEAVTKADALIAADIECRNEMFVVGGGQIYLEFMGRADRMYITNIETGAIECDTFFPKQFFDSRWVEESSEPLESDVGEPVAELVTYTWNAGEKFQQT